MNFVFSVPPCHSIISESSPFITYFQLPCLFHQPGQGNTLPKTNSSHLKIGHPTIHLQLRLLLVSGRVIAFPYETGVVRADITSATRPDKLWTGIASWSHRTSEAMGRDLRKARRAIGKRWLQRWLRDLYG